jgi:hypothetical protein
VIADTRDTIPSVVIFIVITRTRISCRFAAPLPIIVLEERGLVLVGIYRSVHVVAGVAYAMLLSHVDVWDHQNLARVLVAYQCAAHTAVMPSPPEGEGLERG